MMQSRSTHLNYMPLPDEEVVEYARHGQQAAAELLVRRYRSFVENKARSYYVAGADREDVLQEGMIGLCKAIRDYRPDRLHKFRPFAELCVTRQIITAVKAATRHKHGLLNRSVSIYRPLNEESGDGPLMDSIPDRTAASPEDLLLKKQFPLALQRLMQRTLSPLERDVLVQYLSGKSYREMSDNLQCPTKTIDNALQRIKRKIGTLLEQQTSD